MRALVGIVGIMLTLVSASSSAAPPISVLLANPDPKPVLDCDQGPIFVRVGRAGAITVDGMTTDEASIQRCLGEIFQTRAEKLIYFEAESRLPVRTVLSVLERCNSIPNLTIALVTSSISRSQCFVLPIRHIR
jgi:biopolymer transport protein ExbD